ncbi:N(2)-fixation sustaining protein CowN [Candidatus Albibeggiatoa sp. nov. BB20]|uniref:N(2)-fixation sustaining protein CowN n=1 Tax=Candidatus Albibeggiatoa sp. nov. BB20 TaxID=3162723 RepID=UPI0033657791
MSTATADRYVSFEGIHCDANANQLIEMLENHISQNNGDEQWQIYFKQKRAQQMKMQHDNLYFIGSQMNNLQAYFETCKNDEALGLLWQVEQECC